MQHKILILKQPLEIVMESFASNTLSKVSHYFWTENGKNNFRNTLLAICEKNYLKIFFFGKSNVFIKKQFFLEMRIYVWNNVFLEKKFFPRKYSILEKFFFCKINFFKNKFFFWIKIFFLEKILFMKKKFLKKFFRYKNFF